MLADGTPTFEFFQARAAWGKAERAFDAAVQVEAAVERIKAALALFRPDGQLNTRAWAQQQITEALGALVGDAWSKARRLLHDVRTLNHLDWMHAQLVQAVPDPLLREAVIRLRYGRGQMGRAHGTHQAHAAQMVAMAQLLCRRLSSEWPRAYAQVGHILTHTVRASSAVECMNSVLRMHQARHRQVSQGMLDLNACFGIAAPSRTASDVGPIRTNCSGSDSPLTTGGSSCRWIRKH